MNAECRMQNWKRSKFCIRSLEPRRLLLFQKRPHPLLPFFRDTARSDCLDRVWHGISATGLCDVRDQFLAFAHRLRTGGAELPERFLHVRIEIGRDPMDGSV